MDKFLARYCRMWYGGHFCQVKSTVPGCLSGFAQLSNNATTGCSSSNGRSLDDDPSWEAEVLRHEKLLEKLKTQGTEPEKLPFLGREQKVRELPHISFCKKAEYDRNASVLDETFDLLLGSATSHENIPVDSASSNIDRDFIRADVQEILRRLHYSCDLQKVYRRHVEERKTMPTVKYLTEQQLKEEKQKIVQKMIQRLQMPPVMIERKPCADVLSEDKVLNGHERSNVSFVDISEDLCGRERFIVIREPNGILRKASWEERDRLLQIYFPKPHRKIISPSTFQPENLKNIFVMKLHENALDQCVIQHEPDSKEYVQTFEAIYNDIDQNKLYELLRSTRYFGGLIFHLAKHSRLDGIILDMLNTDRLEDAADCVKLLLLLHPNCKTNNIVKNLPDADDFSVIQAYLCKDSSDEKKLSLALKRFKDPKSAESSV